MQQLEYVVGGLWNVAGRYQSEASIEGPFDYTLLLEYIRERPVGHHIDHPIALTDGVRQPGANERRVRYIHFVHVAGIELAPFDRKIRHRRRLDLIIDLLDRPVDHISPRYCFTSAEYVFGRVVGVHVCGDKIHRYL